MASESEMQGEKPEHAISEREEDLSPLWQTPRGQIVWSVAGFDPSSGAGVTADLMTFAAFGLFGCSAITALTVQTTMGVFGWGAVASELFRETLTRLDEDLPPQGIKIGMLATAELAGVTAAFLRVKRDASKSRGRVVVLDPVLRSSSGRTLYPDAGLDLFRKELLPLVDWITPNWAELAVLSEMAIKSLDCAETAGRALMARHPQLGVVVTGGDQSAPFDLVLLQNGTTETLPGNRMETSSTHGTGCAFSSALLSQLVLGASPVEAARAAKRYVEGALRFAPGVGGGRGPMELLWPLRRGGT